MNAKLYRVILPVTDIEKAATFYSSIFHNRGTRVSPGRHYFDCGGTILACYSPQEDGDEIGEGWRLHESQYLYFSVANLEETCELAQEAGAIIRAEIDTMPWGERLFYVKDPFENLICFVDERTVFTG